MGVGMDISILEALEQKQKQHKEEKQKAKETLDASKRELVATALQISKTSKVNKYTLKRIDALLAKHTETGICNDLNLIKSDLKSQLTEHDNWEIFRLRFSKVHKNFFKKLTAKYPKLTKSELKFCAYLRIHLSSSQISSVLHITNEGIRKTRYRIRKKLNLLPKDSLEDFIAKF